MWIQGQKFYRKLGTLPKYAHVGLKTLNAGVHWVYFHPFCVDWETQCPVQADQTGVLEAIEKFREESPHNANIQVPYERYSSEPLYFNKLHGAHFLIQVGADGWNYAGPECKYEKDYRLLNLNEYMEEDFLWHPQRLNALNKINSDNYRTIGTKHRPPVFSDHIEKIINLKDNLSADDSIGDASKFYYPGII